MLGRRVADRRRFKIAMVDVHILGSRRDVRTGEDEMAAGGSGWLHVAIDFGNQALVSDRKARTLDALLNEFEAIDDGD